jgi:putative spermidine/putrescine transport system substrate-binding protein
VAIATLAVPAAIGLACGRASVPSLAERAAVAALPWDSIVARARGSTVRWRMWRGDPSINRFVDEWVTPRLSANYGITLATVDGQGPEIVNDLVVERDAHRATGAASLVWINGETFANLRSEHLLYGPWAGRLPDALYVDSASPIVMRDFEQDPAGYESPWGRVEFAMIYDSTRTPNPPRTYDELVAWMRAHPGRFTHDQRFTGLTFLKGLMYRLGGGVARFQKGGRFDSTLYVEASAKVWEWLARSRPFFWRRGEVYPQGVAELEQLFANREVDFAMSNNQNEVVTKVRQGILPPTSRAYVLRDGAIANSHYLGIPFNAPNPAGAMVVANFLLSPEAQYEKQKPDVWADGTVLARSRLPKEWADKFATQDADARAVPPDTLTKYAVPEVSPRYTELLQRDWRARVRAAPTP